MAYFSKDIYDRKRDYAYRISNEGLEKIALYLVSENPKYKNADLDDEDVQNEIDKEIEDLIYELEPIAELSHLRHNIHSTDRGHFIADSSDLHKVGTEYSDGCLIDDVNELNKKYNLVDEKLRYISLPQCDMDIDSDEDILDYYGEDISEDEDENHEKAYELLFEDWDDCINKWSDSVRQWFREINKKFDTDFPD